MDSAKVFVDSVKAVVIYSSVVPAKIREYAQIKSQSI